MPDDTHIDLSQRVAALEQMLVARTAEHDDRLQQESATRLTLPLDGEGKGGGDRSTSGGGDAKD